MSKSTVIVPILTSRLFEKESERKQRLFNESCFEGLIKSELDELLGADWKLYVHINWTEHFFGLSEERNGYGKMLSRSKRGGTFSISKTGLENLQRHIAAKKRKAQRDVEKSETVMHINNLVSEVLKKFNTEEIGTSVSMVFGDGRIQVYLLRTREGLNSTSLYYKEMYSYIMRDGTHTEPELLSSVSGKTITEFNKLIEIYTPHMNRLNEVVEQIKAALPAEYFITEKA